MGGGKSFFNIYFLFIYLAAPGLSCITWDLRWGMWDLLVAAFELLVAARGIYFPDQGLNLGPLHWERGTLATGPPGKSWEEKSLINKL